MSEGRQAILGRVREALRVPTDEHVRRAPSAPRVDDGEAFRAWLPQAGDTHEQRVATFAELSEKLRTRFVCVADLDAARAEVASIARAEGWRRVATHGRSLACNVAGAAGLGMLNTDGGYDPMELERCDAGVTECDALIAQTGSVLVTALSAGGRALSVLPPHHVVIATAGQLVADMAAGYAVLRERHGDRLPSFVSFITGPSRTGDIERILVLGAHGPKKLTVLMIGRSEQHAAGGVAKL